VLTVLRHGASLGLLAVTVSCTASIVPPSATARVFRHHAAMRMQPGWSSEPSTLFIELIQYVVFARLKQQASKHGSQLLDVEAETSSMRRATAALTRHAQDYCARIAAAATACTRVGAAVAAREAALAAAVERFAMLQMLHDSGERCPCDKDPETGPAFLSACMRVQTFSCRRRIMVQNNVTDVFLPRLQDVRVARVESRRG